MGEAVAVVGGATLLAGSWVAVAGKKTIPHLEVQVFNVINGLPGFLWPVVWVPMQLGSMVGSLVVVALTGARTRQLKLTAAVLVASQGAFWTAKVVKNKVSRGRPDAFLSGIHVREHAGGFGYVSGHAAVAFALAAALTPAMPRRLRLVPLGLAGVVAFGRVYAGAHLPLDVVGGAGIGLLWGTLTRWILGLGGEGLPAAEPTS